MLKSWKFWAVFAALFSVIGLFVYAYSTEPKVVRSPLLGKAAPGFALTRLDDSERLVLAELRGKPVVLNFWGSWCVPCRAEAPILKAVYNLYEKEQGRLRVVGVAVQDTKENAMDFARRYEKNFFLGLDTEAGDIGLSYGLYGVPETFFIDAEGIIRYKQIGQLTVAVMEKQVAALLSRPGSKKE